MVVIECGCGRCGGEVRCWHMSSEVTGLVVGWCHMRLWCEGGCPLLAGCRGSHST